VQSPHTLFSWAFWPIKPDQIYLQAGLTKNQQDDKVSAKWMGEFNFKKPALSCRRMWKSRDHNCVIWGHSRKDGEFLAKICTVEYITDEAGTEAVACARVSCLGVCIHLHLLEWTEWSKSTGRRPRFINHQDSEDFVITTEARKHAHAVTQRWV